MHLPHGFPVGKNAPSRELGFQGGGEIPTLKTIHLKVGDLDPLFLLSYLV
jgi:hypothetical protein